MFTIRPLRWASSEVTAPRYSSGTSTVSRSTGSRRAPLTSRVTPGGGPAGSSVAPPLPLPGVRPVGGQPQDRHVPDQLAVQPVAHHPRGDLGPLVPSHQRRGV